MSTVPNIDAATRALVRARMGTTNVAALVARPRESWQVGRTAMVHAFGAWRTGIIVKVGRTRATVAYITPSNPTQVRVATTDDLRIGQYWTRDRDPWDGVTAA